MNSECNPLPFESVWPLDQLRSRLQRVQGIAEGVDVQELHDKQPLLITNVRQRDCNDFAFMFRLDVCQNLNLNDCCSKAEFAFIE